MSNKIAKMAKQKQYDYTKGGNTYGRVVLPDSTIEQIREEVKKEAHSRAAEESFGCLMAFTDMALREQFGYGDYMCDKFQRAVIDIYEDFEKGTISMESVVEYMKEKIKVIKWED